MDKSVLVLVVYSLATGGIVGVVCRSDPRPYLKSLGISVAITIGLAVIFFAGCAARESFSRNSEFGRALESAIGAGIIISFGLILYCPIPAIIGCLLGKLALHEK
jgi:hypothetical protein